MSTKIGASVVFAVLVMLTGACQRADSDAAERSQVSSPTTTEHLVGPPPSLSHFEAAEQQLAERRYIYAASNLDKGIVAFRIETGKMSGQSAIRANRAIDSLTRLRKVLRHGDAVNSEDLHRAILAAMDSEPRPVSSLPKPSRDLFVPVNGN